MIEIVLLPEATSTPQLVIYLSRREMFPRVALR